MTRRNDVQNYDNRAWGDQNLISEQEVQDLQKKLEKAEKKLAKAKTRAQATMQEIWQLDVRLKEEEERANQAERKLAGLGGGGEVSSDDGSLSAELEELREKLSQAEAEIGRLQAEMEASSVLASAPSADQEQEIVSLQEQLRELQQDRSLEQAQTQVRVAELENRLSEMSAQAEYSEGDEALQARIEELERELAQAGSSATSDEGLEAELQARIEELEKQLSDTAGSGSDDNQQLQARVEELERELSEVSQNGHTSAPVQDLELEQARLDGLRINLHEAEERAREAEEKLGELTSSATLFQEQLQAIQDKVREAEDRAGEWEEKFHRSEERAQSGESAPVDDEELQQLRDRVQELEQQCEQLRSGSDGDARVPELEQTLQQLSQELEQANQTIATLNQGSGGEGSDPALQSELEEARKTIESLRKQLDSATGASDDELVLQYKERLALAEERNDLLKQKAEQASEKYAMAKEELQELEATRSDLRNRVSRAEALAADAEEKLAKNRSAVAASGAASAEVEEQIKVLEQQLQDAVTRGREAQLKSNQAEVQLQKAIVSLKEYEAKANESDRETQRLAFQDSLTGLPNLNLIRQYLNFTVKQVQRYNRASALLVVDLDRFKLINDSMGFKAGDELLKQVAERLQTAIRESDALGRKGEDEFLVLLSELFTGDASVSGEQKTNMIRQNIAIVVNRISECLSRPFLIQGQKFYIRASIGVSICPNDADSAQNMLEHADSAMYHAKESGRGRCVFYNSELHKRQERRLAMDSQLRVAMERGEFVLQYQPVIEIIKGKGQIVGVEALLRWNHRIDGLLRPDAFLDAAEESGLIVQLGQWVCRQACWQLRQWLGQGAQLFVAFNVSTRQLLQADLTEVILNSVEEFGLQPGMVYVEISEGQSVETVDLVERVISSLGQAGIRVAIDDFGVGYSSISKIDLKHIQFLKIDPSLVAGSTNDKAKANICEAAVRLAQSLELKPLAEGVESMAQAKFLSKIGCNFMQGYHIQEPCSAEQVTKLLAERRVWKF